MDKKEIIKNLEVDWELLLDNMRKRRNAKTAYELGMIDWDTLLEILKNLQELE